MKGMSRRRAAYKSPVTKILAVGHPTASGTGLRRFLAEQMADEEREKLLLA